MTKKDTRRNHRIPYLGRVQIHWEVALGQPKHALGRCLDVSESGLRVELPEPIPTHANVLLQADQLNLRGPATVKHVERQGSKYILGLQLSQALRDQTLTAIREPWNIRKTVSVA
jgi:hypothetical protein